MSLRSHKRTCRKPYNGGPYGPYSGGDYGYGQFFVPILSKLPAMAVASSFARKLSNLPLPVATIRRDTDSATLDLYGAGSYGFVPLETVRNFNGWNRLKYSADLRNTSEAGSSRDWANSTGGTGIAVTGSQVAGVSPLGYDATRLQFNLGGGTTMADLTRRVQTSVTTIGVQYVISFKIKSYDGASTYRMHLVSPTGATVNFDCTPEWNTIESTAVAIPSSISFGVGLRGGQTPANSNSADVLVSEVQVEVASTRSTYDHRTTLGAGNSFFTHRYDHSGNDRHFVQSSTSIQRLACIQGVVQQENGRLTGYGIETDARRMQVASSTVMFQEWHQTGGWVLGIANVDDSAGNKPLISTQIGNTSLGFRIQKSSTETWRVVVGDGATTPVDVAFSGSSTSNEVVAFYIDPDNATAANRAYGWSNGVALTGTNAQTATPATGSSATNLTASGQVGTAYWNGTETELLMPITLTTAQRQFYETNAMQLWGLS